LGQPVRTAIQIIPKANPQPKVFIPGTYFLMEKARQITIIKIKSRMNFHFVNTGMALLILFFPIFLLSVVEFLYS